MWKNNAILEQNLEYLAYYAASGDNLLKELSVLHTVPILRDEECKHKCLTFEDGTDIFFVDLVRNYPF
jgi:hypothetical protein